MQTNYGLALRTQVLLRDKLRCQACGIPAKPVLATHHIIPVALDGRDVADNLTTLCANCHRIVHWLSAGDRSVDAHAYGLGQSSTHRRRLLELARRIRRRRLRVIGKDKALTTSVPLQTALATVVQRNGLERDEATLLERCFKRAVGAMAAVDRKSCSVRLPRGARFISVNANNHLTFRAPAWSDNSKERHDKDIMLIWPQHERPSIMSASRFHRTPKFRFTLIPCVELYLTWEECLSFSERDWKLFQKACHDAFTPPTRRWISNVIL